jgi:hypothetical protein
MQLTRGNCEHGSRIDHRAQGGADRCVGLTCRPGGQMQMRILLYGLLLVLSACATRVPYDRQAGPEIKRIGMVTPAVPDSFCARRISTPGAGLGLLGGIVEAAIELQRQKVLNDAMARHGYALRARWTEILAESLTSQGFEVIMVGVQRTGTNRTLLREFPPADVDAYLDSLLTCVGYQAFALNAPYLPWAMVQVRLAAPGNKVLMEDLFEYTLAAQSTIGDVTVVPVRSAHILDRITTATEQPQVAASGMDDAMTALAARIAAAIRR